MPPDLQSSEPDSSGQSSLLPQAESRSSFRRYLPWAILAAPLLLALVVLSLHFLPQTAFSRPTASLPLPEPAIPPSASSPAAVPAVASTAVPLTVTLYSAGSGRHVRVGTAVLISAYAALPPGQSATVSVSYTRNNGPQSLLALAQGSLSSTAWTPSVPGRYNFTASALDSDKNNAASHHLLIYVDAGPAKEVGAAKPLPPAVVPIPSPVRAAAFAAARPARNPALRRVAARLAAPARHLPKPPIHLRPASARQATRAVPRSYPSKASHVEAATFVFQPLAETLAGALRRRGFHAFVRTVTRPHHKPTYAVETGDFQHPADAKRQVETLKRDGYPASIYR